MSAEKIPIKLSPGRTTIKKLQAAGDFGACILMLIISFG